MLTPSKEDLSKQFNRIIWIFGFCLFALILAGVGAASLYLREELRNQVLNRDAFILSKVATSNFNASPDEGSESFQFLQLAEKSAELSGVVGVRLFSDEGKPLTRFPETLANTQIDNRTLNSLRAGQTQSRLFESFNLGTLFTDADILTDPVPIVKIQVPIFDDSQTFLAVVEYWIDASDLPFELGRIDRQIFSLALFLVFISVLFLIGLSLFARHRIIRLAKTLWKRNRELERANADLALSSQSSAVGSISANLIHDLKNPISALRNSLSEESSSEDTKKIAERLNQMIQNSIEYIKIESNDFAPEMTPEELKNFFELKSNSEFSDAGIHLNFSANGEAEIAGQFCPLIGLVSRNLIGNAIEASKRGDSVDINLNSTPSHLTLSVIDQGKGIPQAIQENLFSPIKSEKETGSGLGLAISQQLARQMSGKITLIDSSEKGSHFQLKVPLSKVGVKSALSPI